MKINKKCRIYEYFLHYLNSDEIPVKYCIENCTLKCKKNYKFPNKYNEKQKKIELINIIRELKKIPDKYLEIKE